MSDSEDYNSESDEDYVPSDGEAVSEEDNSGDDEDLSLLKDSVGDEQDTGNKDSDRKRTKAKQSVGQRKRKGGIKLEGEENVDQIKEETEEEKARQKELEEQIVKENEQKKEEQEKKRANDIWSSFLSDVGARPKPKSSTSSATIASLTSPSQPANKVPTNSIDPSSTKSAEKITVTKVFDFAGEEVKITKEVDVGSKEGQEELKKQKDPDKTNESSESSSKNGVSSTVSHSPVCNALSGGVKRPAVGGGLSSVLNKINKKQKISTLEKSKLDWNSFKEKEGISDELALHNRGKKSYIERQNFLNRADYRQFEIEKNLRLSTSKR